MKVGELVALLQKLDPELDVKGEYENNSDVQYLEVLGAGVMLVDSDSNTFDYPLSDEDRIEFDVDEDDLIMVALIGLSRYE